MYQRTLNSISIIKDFIYDEIGVRDVFVFWLRLYSRWHLKVGFYPKVCILRVEADNSPLVLSCVWDLPEILEYQMSDVNIELKYFPEPDYVYSRPVGGALDEDGNQHPKRGNGHNALSLAANFCSDRVIDVLLKSGIKILSGLRFESDDPTAFHVAVSEGHEKTALKLLKYTPVSLLGLPVRDSGQVPFMIACKVGFPGLASSILEALGEDSLVIRDYEDSTPLHLAARYGHIDICKILILTTRGEKMLVSTNIRGYTPLHLAAKSGYIDICKMLVLKMHREDVLGGVDYYGYTAFHLASVSERNALSILELFCNHFKFSELLAQSKDGNTALHLAINHGTLEVIDFLLARMTAEQIQLENVEGISALALATKAENNSRIESGEWVYIEEKVDDFLVVIEHIQQAIRDKSPLEDQQNYTATPH